MLLLRWIPLHELELWRELLILGGAVALYGVLASPPHSPGVSPGDARGDRGRAGRPTGAGGTPALHLIAVLAVAAVTPTHPGKMALVPLLLAMVIFILRLAEPQDLVPTGAAHMGARSSAASRRRINLAVLAAFLTLAAFFARWSLVPLLVAAAFALLVPFLDKLKPLAYAAALALFAMWPWSGVVARALPVVARYDPPAGEVRIVGLALARGQTASVAIPRAGHVTVDASVANGSGLPPGRVVGFIDAGGCTRTIRIGDVADFGFTRREHFFPSRNPLPHVSRADIRGYGSTAWVHGAGAIGVACRGAMMALRFRAADDLPPQARLQIESVELPVARDPSRPFDFAQDRLRGSG